MSDSSSRVVDGKMNDSIDTNSKLDDDDDDHDDLVGRDQDHVKHPILDHQEEEENDIMMKKKYGGLLRKKPSLISKDHERAFFDSADWALRKHGAADRAKGGGPLEELLPKLEPTPHHQLQSKRLAYASSSTDDDEFNHENTSEAAKLDGDEHEFIPDKN